MGTKMFGNKLRGAKFPAIYFSRGMKYYGDDQIDQSNYRIVANALFPSEPYLYVVLREWFSISIPLGSAYEAVPQIPNKTVVMGKEHEMK